MSERDHATERKVHSHHKETHYRCPRHKGIPDYAINYIAYGIFLGSHSATCKPFLLQNHITHVLSLKEDTEDDLSPEITVKKIILEDNDEVRLEDTLDEACRFIDEGTRGNNKILVHCFLGASRSPAVVINYLHRRKGFSMPCAYFFVAGRRPATGLKAGFKSRIVEEAKKENNKINYEQFKLPGDGQYFGERLESNKGYVKKNQERLEREMGMSLEPPEEASKDNIRIRFPSEEGK